MGVVEDQGLLVTGFGWYIGAVPSLPAAHPASARPQRPPTPCPSLPEQHPACRLTAMPNLPHSAQAAPPPRAEASLQEAGDKTQLLLLEQAAHSVPGPDKCTGTS